VKKYFNTKENALRHLEYRKDCAYKRIEENNDFILGDGSFIYQDHRKKWMVFMQIITNSMMNDIEKAKDFPYQSIPLIPFTEEEEFQKKYHNIENLKDKYKTLDVEDYKNIKE